MHWKLFADLAEVAGTREVDVEADVATVGEALDALVERYPAFDDRIFDDGAVRGDVNVLRNGESVHAAEGLDTPVEAGDELALFPPVSGG
ncbi:molybdopterin synthase sulfur carrier subunit [Halobacteriales archaeon QS_1_68_20]|nr:MAG: molybdopterin synthase sulfur carrier subunit [Halobacteriales archaeon QS_1_68_20]